METNSVFARGIGDGGERSAAVTSRCQTMSGAATDVDPSRTNGWRLKAQSHNVAVAQSGNGEERPREIDWLLLTSGRADRLHGDRLLPLLLKVR